MFFKFYFKQLRYSYTIIKNILYKIFISNSWRKQYIDIIQILYNKIISISFLERLLLDRVVKIWTLKLQNSTQCQSITITLHTYVKFIWIMKLIFAISTMQKSSKTKLKSWNYIVAKWIAIVIVEILKSQTWRSKIFRKFEKQFQSIKIFDEIQNCLKRVNTYAIVAFVVQLIIITYVIKLYERKWCYELSEIQRYKNNWNSIVAHWVMLRWSFNKFNFVNLLRRVEMLDIVSQSFYFARAILMQLLHLLFNWQLSHMLQSFNDVNYIMNWENFNVAKIIRIRSLRIELCFVEVLTNSISWICARKTKIRNDVEHLNWSQSSLNKIHINVQNITTQCATIEFE